MAHDTDASLDIPGIIRLAIYRQSTELLDRIGVTMPNAAHIDTGTAHVLGIEVATLTDRQRAYGWAAMCLLLAEKAGLIVALDILDDAREAVERRCNHARYDVVTWLRQAGLSSKTETASHRILAGLRALDAKFATLDARMDRLLDRQDDVLMALGVCPSCLRPVTQCEAEVPTLTDRR